MHTHALAWLFAGLLAGCAVVSSDTGSGNPSTALTIQVNSAPPQDKTEERAASPGYGFIWVAGYWDNIDGNYVWRPGRWVQGKPDYEYVRARYEYNGSAWIFHRPHWKKRHTQAAPG